MKTVERPMYFEYPGKNPQRLRNMYVGNRLKHKNDKDLSKPYFALNLSVKIAGKNDKTNPAHS